MKNLHRPSFFRELLSHLIVAIIVWLTFKCLMWTTRNWTEKTVVQYVNSTAIVLEENHSKIELVFIVLIVSSYHVASRIYKGYKLGGMARAAGMFFYSPNSSGRTINKNNRFLKKKSLACRQIKILGATGWKTFGEIHSPLNEALQKCTSAEIILLSPLSNNLKERAKDVKQGEKSYREEILKSILFLNKGLEKY